MKQTVQKEQKHLKPQPESKDASESMSDKSQPRRIKRDTKKLE